MANPNGAKGTKWETAVERFLAPLGARKHPKRGSRDESDLHAGPWALECKNTGRFTPAQFMNEAEAEAAHAGKPYGAAVVKRRRGTGSPGTVETGYVLMSLDTFRRSELDRMRQEQQLEAMYRYREVVEGLPTGTLPLRAGEEETGGKDRQEA